MPPACSRKKTSTTISSLRLIDGLSVEITKRNRQKNLYVRVHPPDGKVTVSAPLHYPDQKIISFVLQKLPRIKASQERIRSEFRHAFREYISGETHYLWGKPYMLEVVTEGRQYLIQEESSKLIFTVPKGATRESKERAFNAWYRQELQNVLPKIAKPIEEKMGLHAHEYRIKNMKTRWGTCNIEKKRIWVNLQLVKKPVACLASIITHELAHLVEKNHNECFYALVERYDSNWKETKKILNTPPYVV
ncbi:MAG: M48 family metallopeptidase [Clostridiaceae bacterium]|jgi:predicted metal-dependent hydrolase|nr:M48 family metallopeptidase [Clostridiaceae bacterium]